jgi:hypothetical protein
MVICRDISQLQQVESQGCAAHSQAVFSLVQGSVVRKQLTLSPY